MLKKTALIASLLILSACHPTPNRISTGGTVDCNRLKRDLNLAFHRHTPGANYGKSVGPTQRASEMQLYEKDCVNN